MYIEKLILHEGAFTCNDEFEKLNLIYSKKNSCGKSTYFRFLFYALGYPVPSMKGVDYVDVNTELVISIKGNRYYITRTYNAISLLNITTNIKQVFTLPQEHLLFLSQIFGSDNIKVINNLIGIMYVDQDKGWSLLNRGTVIGRIKFSIEELIAGLAGIDCDELLAKKKDLKISENKYKAMISINQISEEVYANNGEIFISDVEKTLLSSISLIDLKIRDVKEKLKNIEKAINEEDSFWRFVDSMNLKVKHNNEQILVNRNNVVYSDEALEYMKTRKSFINTELQELFNEKASLNEKLSNYYRDNTLITQYLGDTEETILTRQLSTVSFDNSTVEKLLEKVQKELKLINRKIKNTLKGNNPYIQKIFNYVKKYAEILQIDDKIINKKDYIFTDDLKSFSGAILQKLVFAFKVAFLKVIEECLDCKLIMILDSPRGKELDNANFALIMKIVNEELSNNQIFVGSIFDDCNYLKKIELKKHAIENR